jgi:hypothetical protein
MKKIIVTFLALSLVLVSCKKMQIAEVTIRYEVEAISSIRDYSVYFSNEIDGEDVKRNVNSFLFIKEIFVLSNEQPKDYFLSVECLEDLVGNTQQQITTRIYEDNVLIIERFTGGSSDIMEGRTEISAYLPTGIKYN